MCMNVNNGLQPMKSQRKKKLKISIRQKQPINIVLFVVKTGPKLYIRTKAKSLHYYKAR
jgi:hypothetical protein